MSTKKLGTVQDVVSHIRSLAGKVALFWRVVEHGENKLSIFVSLGAGQGEQEVQIEICLPDSVKICVLTTIQIDDTVLEWLDDAGFDTSDEETEWAEGLIIDDDADPGSEDFPATINKIAHLPRRLEVALAVARAAFLAALNGETDW